MRRVIAPLTSLAAVCALALAAAAQVNPPVPPPAGPVNPPGTSRRRRRAAPPRPRPPPAPDAITPAPLASPTQPPIIVEPPQVSVEPGKTVGRAREQLAGHADGDRRRPDDRNRRRRPGPTPALRDGRESRHHHRDGDRLAQRLARRPDPRRLRRRHRRRRNDAARHGQPDVVGLPARSGRARGRPRGHAALGRIDQRPAGNDPDSRQLEDRRPHGARRPVANRGQRLPARQRHDARDRREHGAPVDPTGAPARERLPGTPHRQRRPVHRAPRPHASAAVPVLPLQPGDGTGAPHPAQSPQRVERAGNGADDRRQRRPGHQRDGGRPPLHQTVPRARSAQRRPSDDDRAGRDDEPRRSPAPAQRTS